MLADDLHRPQRRQVARDARPRATVVGALEHIRLHVVTAVPVERGVHRTFGVLRELHTTHVRRVRHARETRDATPSAPIVLRDGNHAVVGTNREHTSATRRLAHRTDVAERCRAFVQAKRITRRYHTAHGQLIAIQVAREIGADRLPSVLLNRWFAAKYTVPAAWRDGTMGALQL